MLRYYFITYTPSSDDNISFVGGAGAGGQSTFIRLDGIDLSCGAPVCRVLQALQEVSEYFIFSREHPDSNVHYHGAGKVKESISYKDTDWLANKLRPFFPKESSGKFATRISWPKPKPNATVEAQSERTLAYCQKEDKNAFKFNITPELQEIMDTINNETPNRDPVTYEFAKSERDYFCRVMRQIRGLPADHQRWVYITLNGDPRLTIWRVMQHDPVVYMGNFNRIADGLRQQMIKERIGVTDYEMEWRPGDPQYQNAFN